MRAAIGLRGAINCKLEGCKIGHTGGSGVHVTTLEYDPADAMNYLESSNNAIAGCEIFDVNGHGVLIGDQYALVDDWTSTGMPTKREPSVGNQITGCKIHHYGTVYRDAVGIYLGHTRSTLVESNEIAQGHWAGISTGTFMGQQWPQNGQGVSCASDRPVNHEYLRILKNWIHNTNLRVTDGGAIYSMGMHGRYPATPQGTPSKIQHNYIRDCIVSPYLNSPSHVKGMHFDKGSAGWEITANYVTRCNWLFQFASDGSVSQPRDGTVGHFGTATWPLDFAYQACTGTACQTGQTCYTLSGMLWNGLPQWDNYWHRQGTGPSPWRPLTVCKGYPAIMPDPTNVGPANHYLTSSTDPAPEAANIIGQTPAASPNWSTLYPNWQGGSQRIYGNFPGNPCGPGGSPPNPDDPMF